MSGDVNSDPNTSQSFAADDISIVLADYSFPEQLNSMNLLMTSQYAKVIFHDIADTYPTDADICCRYTLTNGVIPTQGDRIALYKVGWSSVEEFIHFEYAPVQDPKQSECQVLFKASTLPKDVNDFYQLAYLTSNNSVCGLSVPFQFRRPFDEELCAFEEQDGLVIIRSKAAVNEEKLHEAEKLKANLQQEKLEAETKLRQLEKIESKKNKELEEAKFKLDSLQNEKKSLESKLEENMHVERHLTRLKQDLLSLDQEKNEAEMKLQKAEAHIQVLSSTVDTLTSDKEHMSELLRNEAKQNVEHSQYKNQVDNLQHMLDVMTQSKEMVKQELRTEMDLNQTLREELRFLQMEVNNLKDMLGLRETEKEELYNRILLSDVEIKDLQMALEETISSKQQTNDMLSNRIKELEENKDQLLSELIRISGKEKDDKDKICLLTDQLTKAVSDVTHLQNVLDDTTNSLKEERQNTSVTVTSNSVLEKSVQQVKLELHVALEQKKKLQRNVELLHEEVDNLKKELNSQKQLHQYECGSKQLESDMLSKKMSFYETSASLESRKEMLNAYLKEAKEKEKVQQDRLITINKRLSEVCEEEDKLTIELQQVQQIYLEKNEELKNLKSSAQFQNNAFDPLTEGSWNFSQGLTTMDDELQNIECCVESSHMRQVQLEEQRLELFEEKTVLTLQRDNTSERLKTLATERRDIVNHLSELDTEEINLLRQNIETLQFPKGQSDDSGSFDEEKRQLLFMLEDCSNLDRKNAKEKEEEMKLRLRLAAAEYRKLYLEKMKIEKRLTRLMQKLSEKKSKSISEEAQTEPLINLSETSTVTRPTQPAAQATRQSNASICPFCSLPFPPGSYDLFATHFENHLS